MDFDCLGCKIGMGGCILLILKTSEKTHCAQITYQGKIFQEVWWHRKKNAMPLMALSDSRVKIIFTHQGKIFQEAW